MGRRLLLFTRGRAGVAPSELCVSGAGGAAGSVHARWVITDLGTLGGKESAAAVAINERGQIVGTSDTRIPNGDEQISHAFLWQNGKMSDLGALARGEYSWASGINERGQVVGTSKTWAKNAIGPHAFLWQNGKMRDLTPEPQLNRLVCYPPGPGNCMVNEAAINDRGQVVVSTGSNGNLAVERAALWQNGKLIDLGSLGRSEFDETIVHAINNRGQIVGTSDTRAKNADGDRIYHAFVWQNGKMTALGSFAGNSYAADINERAQVVVLAATKATDENGDPIWHAFLWQNGKMTYLGTLGGQESVAWAINDRGQIVGYSDTATGEIHAFLWQNGKMTDLGTLGGTSEAVLINERGQVVGTFDTGAKGKYGDPLTHAFLWENGTMTDLGTLGGKESEALAINEHNQIVGDSTTKTGQYRAVLWTLKPGS